MRAAIMCVVGTRPEGVKLAPVILALRDHPTLQPLVCATGQHRELLRSALEGFGIDADIDLDVLQRGQTPADVIASTLPALMAVIAAAAPAAVVVQGDTATAFAAAQAAGYSRVPLVHVEAGLRTGVADEPFPEEMHRRAIAQLASLHFAPTVTAQRALIAEGIDPARIHVTGNSGVDALRLVEARLSDPFEAARQFASHPRLDPSRPLVVVTVHRRENHDAPLHRIIDALERLVDEGVEVVLPVHPHPKIGEVLRARLGERPFVHLVPPLDHASFIALMRRAAVVLTDSGGVQEEAPALGVPVLVMRGVTERAEGIASGNARMVGTSTAAIVAGVRALLGDPRALARMSAPALPYGDGEATPRIVAVMARLFGPASARAELVH
ncbi:UDP-N-acetylglucosamine 2-epimerase (non-hydrolyzing) [Sphingosinicellaceae bacterium]|nr:UDP-N-acetylglucosamine 2-epimerase (non-hydrolyzing) [Sphingosinicellaceae bacterium]